MLGFKPVVADTITIKEGGHLRHMFFDVGGDQLIGFLEPNGVPNVPAKYDAGINGGLGVPAAFYHFAFEAGSTAALIVDHGLAQSIYFKDPNGLSLEYCCLVGDPPEPGALRHSEFTLPHAALELTDTLTQARSAGDRAKMGVSRHKFAAAISWLADQLIKSFAAYAEIIYPCFDDPGDLIKGQKPERDSERLAEGGEPRAVGKSANRFSQSDRPSPVIRRCRQGLGASDESMPSALVNLTSEPAADNGLAPSSPMRSARPGQRPMARCGAR